eukprot:6208508-Pleurochrysis_carterae.AAC.1
MPLVGGTDLNGTASGDPTDLRKIGVKLGCRHNVTDLKVLSKKSKKTGCTAPRRDHAETTMALIQTTDVSRSYPGQAIFKSPEPVPARAATSQHEWVRAGVTVVQCLAWQPLPPSLQKAYPVVTYDVRIKIRAASSCAAAGMGLGLNNRILFGQCPVLSLAFMRFFEQAENDIIKTRSGTSSGHQTSGSLVLHNVIGDYARREAFKLTSKGMLSLFQMFWKAFK